MKIKAPLDRYLMMVILSLIITLIKIDGAFWRLWFISFIFTFFYWEGNFLIVIYFREKLPKIKQTAQRIFTQVAVSMGYTFGINLLLVLVLDFLSIVPYDSTFHFKTLYIGLVITVIISSIYETVFYFQLWKTALLESEKLKKTEALLQYESLKNQVNPHFLFNSLNTLSALIQIDQEKAELFVKEFARIYRYVLQVKEKTYVPLEEEMKFVNSYVFLQKIRFDNQLIFNSNFETSIENYFIPPLILQNLVENCVKHNIINEKYPLFVELTIQNSTLTVRNTLQEKENHNDSTKTGLKNISQRLKLLNDKEPRFYKKDGCFYAEVPLIKSE